MTDEELIELAISTWRRYRGGQNYTCSLPNKDLSRVERLTTGQRLVILRNLYGVVSTWGVQDDGRSLCFIR